MASQGPGGAIHAVPKDSVHKICSGQVILDLATAVKELVENALDAGATSVEVRLKEYGVDLIEVADNGTGVDRGSFASLAAKHHTSKIRDFADLEALSTFGFRGEALSSLCAVAAVSVVTRTASDATGTRVVYDRAGGVASTEPAARAVGTTVAVESLFAPLPVRRQELVRNAKREYTRLLQVLQSYALVCEGVRLLCTNQTGTGPRQTVVSTLKRQGQRQAIAAVFGAKAVAGLMQVEKAVALVSEDPAPGKNRPDRATPAAATEGAAEGAPQTQTHSQPQSLSLPSADAAGRLSLGSFALSAGQTQAAGPGAGEGTARGEGAGPGDGSGAVASIALSPAQSGLPPAPLSLGADPTRAVIRGWVSRPEAGCGRASGDRQFFYLNGRPIDFPRAAKVVNEAFRAQTSPLGSTAAHKPAAILDIVVGRGAVDVNVTPDKRKVLLHHEGAILTAMREMLEEAWAPHHSTYRVSDVLCPLQGGRGRRSRGSMGGVESEGVGDEGEGGAGVGAELGGGGVDVSERGQDLPADVERREGEAARGENGTQSEGGDDVMSDRNDEGLQRTAHGIRAEVRGCDGGGDEVGLSGAGRGKRRAEGVAAAVAGTSSGGDVMGSGHLAWTGRGGGARAAKRARGGEGGGGRERAFMRAFLGGKGGEPAPATREDEGEVGDDDGGGAVGERVDDGGGNEAGDGEENGGGSEAGVGTERVVLATPEEATGDVDISEVPVGGDEGEGGGEDGAGVVEEMLGEGKGVEEALAMGVELPPPFEEGPLGIGAGEGEDADMPVAAWDQPRVLPSGDVEAAFDAEKLRQLYQRLAEGAAARRAAGEARPVGRARDEDRGGEMELGAFAMGQGGAGAAGVSQARPGEGRARRRAFVAATLALGGGTGGPSQGGGREGAERAREGDAPLREGLDEAGRELDRVFDKRDFSRMDIIGQFNLGFILCRLGRDVFIVDQHASDEKSTFERLCATTAMTRQALLRPLPLPLSPAEEAVVRDAAPVFEANGFAFSDDPDTGRLMLSAVPVSKGVQLGPEDVVELAALVRGGEGAAQGWRWGEGTGGRGRVLRPSRVRAMLASRACRSSVMIGKALDRRAMRRIVDRLSELDSPWNCPHGRPTMRHLFALADGRDADNE